MTGMILGEKLIAIKTIARSECPMEWCSFVGEVRFREGLDAVEDLAEIMKEHLWESHKREGFMKMKAAK